ncbi:MAG: hypothetical protein WCC48_02150 [Anaeromyxobacteraceae bacterium]
MIGSLSALALALLPVAGHDANAGNLPVCANRVIRQVVRRVGCTVGDTRCWTRAGGFCTDHIEKRLGARRDGGADPMAPVATEQVRTGDVAAFASRAHYAYVEEVLRDRAGAPVAVELSELNFGTCWVDEGAMVTERYGLLGRRRVVVRDVDGGFLRARSPSR